MICSISVMSLNIFVTLLVMGLKCWIHFQYTALFLSTHHYSIILTLNVAAIRSEGDKVAVLIIVIFIITPDVVLNVAAIQSEGDKAVVLIIVISIVTPVVVVILIVLIISSLLHERKKNIITPLVKRDAIVC